MLFYLLLSCIVVVVVVSVGVINVVVAVVVVFSFVFVVSVASQLHPTGGNMLETWPETISKQLELTPFASSRFMLIIAFMVLRFEPEKPMKSLDDTCESKKQLMTHSSRQIRPNRGELPCHEEQCLNGNSETIRSNRPWPETRARSGCVRENNHDNNDNKDQTIRTRQ